MHSAVLFSLALAAAVRGQKAGTLTTETHPKLNIQKCAAGGTCTTTSQPIVLDGNWRWLHDSTGTNCYTGNAWNTALCPDPVTCATNCALDGADYSGTYGITTSGDALTLKFVTTTSTGTNIGSRVFLMADDTHYQMFNLKNQEFTFDVDVSKLPCGLNGALYFSEMDADGGLAKYTNNKAGAKYGTGYCDSQCPHDIKFINGEANLLGWNPSGNDANSGSGQYGTCCSEMDIWEANSMATAYTPHVCSISGPSRCTGTACGDGSDRYSGTCDKDGCDFNSYRMGDTSFYGASKTVDTTKKFTVVTQFITADGTATGALSEIRRIYVQGGKVIQNSKTNIPGITTAYDSITDSFCAAQKTTFGDTNYFSTKGGIKGMGDAYSTGMVLVMSLWDDHAVNMLWLDSTYPTNSTHVGAARGACSTTSGAPSDVEKNSPGATVIYSAIKYGPIGSTFASGTTTTSVGGSTSTTSKTTTSTAPATTGVAHYGQCGGIGYSGSTTCASPYSCVVSSAYYSQCL